MESGKQQVVVQLGEDQLQEMLTRAMETGVMSGIAKYDEKRRKTAKQITDRRYHNTKLLLRNFRMLKLNAENSVFGRTQMGESAADVLLSMMDMYDDEMIVESIRRSATRTAIIVSHVETMLKLFEVYCTNENTDMAARRYDLIYRMYIAEDKMSRKELAEKWHVSLDLTYDDEKNSIESLSALIFGVDGLTVH